MVNLVSGQILADKIIDIKSDKNTYEAWFLNLKSIYNIQVFVEDSNLLNQRFDFTKDSISLSTAMRTVLPPKFHFVEYNGQLLIVKDLNLIYKLPEYKSILEINENLVNKNDFVQTQTVKVLPAIVVGTNNSSNKTKVSIGIRILDVESGKPVYGATVMVSPLQMGAVTEINGFAYFSINKGEYTLKIRSLGYEETELKLIVLGDGQTDFKLAPASIQLKETEIFGDRQKDITRKEAGIEKFSGKEVRSIPTMGGETDFVKVTSLLPGIHSIGEGAAGINVRGGGFDQNAFFINDIPVYNTSHIFGFFPAFNPNMIDNMTVYKGFMPADFGGKLSGIFDLETRHGNKKDFGVRGGISPLAANILVEGPIINEKLSYMISGRASFSDWILRSFQDTILNRSQAGFNDLTGMFDFNDGKTRLSLSGYHSGDDFLMYKTSQYQYNNDGFSLKAGRKLTDFLYLNTSLFFGSYNFSSSEIKYNSSAYTNQYSIRHSGFKVKFDQDISDKHHLIYGFESELLNLDRGNVSPASESSQIKPVDFGKERGVESAIYLSDKYDAVKWLSFNAGFRLANFLTLGPQTEYLFVAGLPKDARFIEDSLVFGTNEIIRSDFFPEYRLTATIFTDRNGSLKLSANSVHQNLFLLNTTPALSPSSQWKLTDYYMNPSKGQIYSVGIFRKFPSYSLDISTEVFYKKINDFPEFIDGADFISNPLVETSTLQGLLTTYGLELFVKKSFSRVSGWLSYTYSRSLVTVNGENDWEKINNGATYSSNFDIPHSFNGVINFQVRRRMQFSSIITWQNGRPATLPVGTYILNNGSYLDYSSRNYYRIPNYFRIDLSLTIEGNLRRNKLIHSSLVISVYNLTGRDNPYSVFYDSVRGYINGYQYSVIAVPVFSATWLFKLGNYATR